MHCSLNLTRSYNNGILIPVEQSRNCLWVEIVSVLLRVFSLESVCLCSVLLVGTRNQFGPAVAADMEVFFFLVLWHTKTDTR